jgi:hypothetical protein
MTAERGSSLRNNEPRLVFLVLEELVTRESIDELSDEGLAEEIVDHDSGISLLSLGLRLS